MLDQTIKHPRKAYPSDLTDREWEVIASLLPAARTEHGGRPRKVDLREVMNTIRYVNRSGCQWDMIPHDLLPKSTAYEYFAMWRDDGTWQTILDALREAVRVAAGREATPSALCIDSQSVKTTEVGGSDRGYDGGKKIAGRKRHLVVDTLGLLVAVLVAGAHADDGATAPQLMGKVSVSAFPRVEAVFGDTKYHNRNFEAWLRTERANWRLEISSNPEKTKGFKPLKIRWVSERTNAWNGRCRRNSKDYECHAKSSEAMIEITQCSLMLRRLTKENKHSFSYKKKDVEKVLENQQLVSG